MCLVDDGVELDKFHGGFFKAGLKLRSGCCRSSCNHGYVQLLYVGSWYNENGRQEHFEGLGNWMEHVERHGYASGLVAVIGCDLKLWRALRMRLGMQMGTYWRTDYLGSLCRSFQPGFGMHPGSLPPTQLIVGFAYQLGARK